MMQWVARRPLFAALAGLALLLAVAIALEAAFGTRAGEAGSTPAKVAAAADAKLLPPVVAQAPEQAYPEMAARPLFTPTRRPAPPDPSAGRSSLVRGQYVLQGVIVVGDQRTALLKEKSSGKVHRVDRGQDVNGVVVERIDPTEVTLAMGGEREDLALVVQRADGKAPGPAPEAAGPFGAPAAPTPAATPAAGQAPAPAAPQSPLQAARAAAAAAAANRSPHAQVPQNPNAQPMSPEELLARRRARRSQPTQ